MQHLGFLVLDMQERLLSQIPQHDLLLDRVAGMLEIASCLDIPTGVCEQVPEKLGLTHPTIRNACAETAVFFEKKGFSALSASGMDTWLSGHQIQHLLIAGIETPICVYQSVLDAVHKQLDCTVLSDCVGEARSMDRDPVLQQFIAMEVPVLPAETIIYSLLGSAQHPKFSEVNQIVKRHRHPLAGSFES